jgi:S-adenosylmethionine hydrolase
VFDLSGASAQYAASATFHGRDVFAPLAARLARGERLAQMGEPMDRADIERPDWADPSCGPCGVDARVLHVDRYGNCLLSLRAGFEAPGPKSWLRMSWGQRRGVRPVSTYADIGPGEIGLLSGSQGFLELAANQAPAAEALGLRRGDSVRLLWG